MPCCCWWGWRWWVEEGGGRGWGGCCCFFLLGVGGWGEVGIRVQYRWAAAVSFSISDVSNNNNKTWSLAPRRLPPRVYIGQLRLRKIRWRGDQFPFYLFIYFFCFPPPSSPFPLRSPPPSPLGACAVGRHRRPRQLSSRSDHVIFKLASVADRRVKSHTFFFWGKEVIAIIKKNKKRGKAIRCPSLWTYTMSSLLKVDNEIKTKVTKKNSCETTSPPSLLMSCCVPPVATFLAWCYGFNWGGGQSYMLTLASSIWLSIIPPIVQRFVSSKLKTQQQESLNGGWKILVT